MDSFDPTPEGDEAARTLPRMAKPAMTPYFAYGSNIHLAQMAQRCPSSVFRGKATLPKYRWQINQRGVANVVPCDDPGCAVEGLLYLINAKDEKALDRSEGVAKNFYQKSLLKVILEPHERFSGRKTGALSALLSGHGGVAEYEGIGSHAAHADIVEPHSTAPLLESLGTGRHTQTSPPEHVKALVYLSENYADDGEIRQEYIGRMQKAIADGLTLGISRSFVEEYIRPHLTGTVPRDTAAVVARKSRAESKGRSDREIAPDPILKSRHVEMEVTREQESKPYILVEYSKEVSSLPGKKVDVQSLKRENRQRHHESSLRFSEEMLDLLVDAHAADLGHDKTIFNVVCKERSPQSDVQFSILATTIDLELANESAMRHFREAWSRTPELHLEGSNNWIRSNTEQCLRGCTIWHLNGNGCLRLSATSLDGLNQSIVWVNAQTLLIRDT